MSKTIYIISGCNGAGKTTASYTILPEILDSKEFVNADEIAKGISPFQPEKAAFEAGRIMINRIDDLMEGQSNFAFETTLATKSYKHKIIKAKQYGFRVVLLFFWLNSDELAKERVRTRVLDGGHNIPNNVIERRYFSGLKNLFSIYFDLVNELFIFDNSNGKQKLIAESTTKKGLKIYDTAIYNQIKIQAK